jgi:hypothetical protein
MSSHVTLTDIYHEDKDVPRSPPIATAVESGEMCMIFTGQDHGRTATYFAMLLACQQKGER